MRSMLSIMKFGGTSMGSADAMLQSARIVQKAAQKKNVIVVVSAMSGVTDQLIEMLSLAHAGKRSRIEGALEQLEQRHYDTLATFTETEVLEEVWMHDFASVFERLRLILTGTSYVGDSTNHTYAIVCSYGERLSSRLMTYALRAQGLESERVDATRLIRTDAEVLEAGVDFPKTRTCCKRVLSPLVDQSIVPVVMGFVGQDSKKNLTLLGRGGSDYTASILAVSLDADAVEIWTDVDGIASADPRKIPDAHIWKSIDMSLMAEMSFSGAKVLHPKTISAAVQRAIPVWIKNTFNPSAQGTKVVMQSSKSAMSDVKGIVVDKKQMLYNFSDPDILQSIGFIKECSSIFAEHNAPIDVCATSEISFTCSLNPADDSPQLRKALEKFVPTQVVEHIAKLCIIGHRIGSNPTILATVFRTLQDKQMYTTSIDASCNNITLLVDQKHADDILVQLHAKLFEKIK